jgi:two-component system, chemotaxis family, CheB/CheR fusion protein
VSPLDPDDHGTPHLGFPVVGVGASAGGIEALQELFSHVDAELEVAFVVMIHLARDMPSALDTILAELCPFPVVNVTEDTALRAGHIYLGPPGQSLRVRGGKLQVDRDGATGAHTIDALLRSLAADRGPEAVAVILSGTGSDGTLGAREVKGMGGMTVAQEPATAAYAAMPQSAIATGLVDQVLAPSAIPEALRQYASGLREVLGDQRPNAFPPAFEEILRLLHRHAGHDFSHYKRTPLRRRLERRTLLHGLESPEAYLQFLQEHPAELVPLFHDLLIGVTSFFRDPEAFEALGPALENRLRRVPEDAPFRVWVIGCSTGEEAYSIAMVLTEAMESVGVHPPVEIFATDANEEAVDVARAGVYPGGISADVSPERLARFFVEESGQYRVTKDLRAMVVFGVQSALTDPPFTNMDLVSCRNLLIYLEPRAQRRLLSVIHMVLKREGLLFLGGSEALGAMADYFTRPDPQHHLHMRRAIPPPPEAYEQMPAGPRRRPSRATARTNPALLPLSDQLDAYLLQAFAPPAVVCSKQGGIVHVHGQVGQYLRMGEGPPTLNLTAMAAPGLIEDLHAALMMADTSEEPIVRSGVPVGSASGERVDIEVSRIRHPEQLSGLFVIAFRESHPDGPDESDEVPSGARDAVAHARTEHELHRTRAVLQSTIEAYQATNEELRLSNEELQSTNEELKTSKEELQTLNEELHTVNQEAQERMQSLSRSHDDMKNLLNSANVPTLFLDQELRIKRFTPQARAVVSLIPSDVGRPLSDLATQLEDVDLEAHARWVMEAAAHRRTEVRTKDGHSYLMSIHPYRLTDDVISGLVITFVDITDLKETQRELQGSRGAIQAIAEMVEEPLVLLDLEGRIELANHGFRALLGDAGSGSVPASVDELAAAVFETPTVRKLLDAVIYGDQDPPVRRRLELQFSGGKPQTIDATARMLSIDQVGQRVLLVMKPVDSS